MESVYEDILKTVYVGMALFCGGISKIIRLCEFTEYPVHILRISRCRHDAFLSALIFSKCARPNARNADYFPCDLLRALGGPKKYEIAL